MFISCDELTGGVVTGVSCGVSLSSGAGVVVLLPVPLLPLPLPLLLPLSLLLLPVLLLPLADSFFSGIAGMVMPPIRTLPLGEREATTSFEDKIGKKLLDSRLSVVNYSSMTE